MPNPYNPNPYNEDQDRARQQPLYDQPGGPRQDASQEYHKGDGVFQIPWWVIVITFCFAAWPIGVAMMIINHLLRMGKISAPQSWSQNNRQTGQPYTVRPIYADPQKAEKMRRDAQGVEGENIRESKQRIEQVMDTLVTAFEAQLDRLFEDDALDVSTDIDVMENMLRADGLTGNTGNSPKLQL